MVEKAFLCLPDKKVYNSGEVSIEEFLDDIFKSKTKYSVVLLWRLMNLPLFKRQLIHQSKKSGRCREG